MFDIGKLLIDNFKDPTQAHAMLVSYGHEVTFPAVYQWFYRAAIPSKWVLTLLGIYEMEHGRPVSLARYIQ